jgi:SpoIID/LytB domain protein
MMATRIGKSSLQGLLVIAMIAFVFPALGQSANLTGNDRHSLLYTPQFHFTEDGDPIIRVHLRDADKSVEFTPSEDILVLPSGEGGASIRLPGRIRYTMKISDSTPGEYRHLVVVDRLLVTEKDRLAEITRQWLGRGYNAEAKEVGGLFAMKGRVLDSRRLLVSVFGTDRLEDARTIRTRLEARHGIRAGIHSEVVRRPQGRLTLSGRGRKVVVEAPNVLWVRGANPTGSEIRYTIPGIQKSYGKGAETRTYTGTLVFAPSRKGGLVAMCELGAERLLRGVVAAEIYASSPAAALRAQAVAARNEIFAAIGVRNLADPFTQRSDVMDQVYGGVGAERDSTTKAVKATRGAVMFVDGAIAQAFYSSNSGGMSEHNENVWDMGARKHLRGKPDGPMELVPEQFRDGVSEDELDAFLVSPFPSYSLKTPKGSRLYRWKDTATPEGARAWLKENRRDPGPIRDVRILERGFSGRVVTLEVVGDHATIVVERELNVRRMFGNLKSGLFLMDIERHPKGLIKRFSFSGGGFGHGVGMSQSGAIGMAAKGHGHEDILMHYYSGVVLGRLY